MMKIPRLSVCQSGPIRVRLYLWTTSIQPWRTKACATCGNLARCERCELDMKTGKELISGYEEGVGRLALKTSKGSIDFPAGAGIEDLDLQSHGLGCRPHLSQRGLGAGGIGWIDQYRHPCCARHQLAQQLETLGRQLGVDEIDSGRIATRTGEAGDQAEPYWVFGNRENDGDRRSCRLGRQCRLRTAGGYDHGNRPAH
jgi:hypothetical protein